MHDMRHMKHGMTFGLVVALLALLGPSQSARADEPAVQDGEPSAVRQRQGGSGERGDRKGAADRTDRTDKTDRAKKPDKTADADETEKADRTSDAESRFVDRDGDGIQDGQEHRFRGRHRRRAATADDRGRRRHRGRKSSGGPGRGR